MALHLDLRGGTKTSRNTLIGGKIRQRPRVQDESSNVLNGLTGREDTQIIIKYEISTAVLTINVDKDREEQHPPLLL